MPGRSPFPAAASTPARDAAAAALREAQEEILLDPAHCEVVGAIEPYRTITGYLVTPVSAVIPPDLPLEPHEREVADWFEPPLQLPARPRQSAAAKRPIPRRNAPLLRNALGRPQDMGSDCSNDRQPVATAAVALILDAPKWRKSAG